MTPWPARASRDAANAPAPPARWAGTRRTRSTRRGTPTAPGTGLGAGNGWHRRGSCLVAAPPVAEPARPRRGPGPGRARRTRPRAGPGPRPLGKALHPRQRRRDDEVAAPRPGTAALGSSHDDVMVRYHRRVDPDRDGTTLDDGHARALSFSRTRPPAPPRAPSGDTGCEPGGPSTALTPDATRPNTPAATKGHPRLWVIRCSGPVGQHQLPDPAPSIPSTESTREQDLSDDLFHEPEAQPKSVTAEALSRDHPTWPPAQHKRLPLVIQASYSRSGRSIDVSRSSGTGSRADPLCAGS